MANEAFYSGLIYAVFLTVLSAVFATWVFSRKNMGYTVSEITDLRIYPIKSCRGISVPFTTLTRQGLQYDRRWMFVDKNNKFITIRQRPQMTLVNTAIDHDAGMLVVRIGDDMDKQIKVPLEPDEEWLTQNTRQATVEIWEHETDAYMYTDPRIQEIFRDHIGEGEDVDLVMKDPNTPRICGGNGDPRVLGRKESVNFPDVLPILIASDSSINELNSRLTADGNEAISIERFRPNVIIKGDEPWSEDSWKTVRINGSSSMFSTLTGGNLNAIDVDVVARCTRCQVPNVNPDTAEKNPKQPWDTLMKYRRIDEGMKYKPCFGMLSCPRNEGKVGVGMRFEVLEVTDQHKYIKGF